MSAQENNSGARNAPQAAQAQTQAQPQPQAHPANPAPIARFRLLYQSGDGKMCLFEDAEGHLTAVNSASLA